MLTLVFGTLHALLLWLLLQCLFAGSVFCLRQRNRQRNLKDDNRVLAGTVALLQRAESYTWWWLLVLANLPFLKPAVRTVLWRLGIGPWPRWGGENPVEQYALAHALFIAGTLLSCCGLGTAYLLARTARSRIGQAACSLQAALLLLGLILTPRAYQENACQITKETGQVFVLESRLFSLVCSRR